MQEKQIGADKIQHHRKNGKAENPVEDAPPERQDRIFIAVIHIDEHKKKQGKQFRKAEPFDHVVSLRSACMRRVSESVMAGQSPAKNPPPFLL